LWYIIDPTPRRFFERSTMISDKRIAFALLSSLLVALLLGAALAGADQMDVPAEGSREVAVDSCEGVIIGNADGSPPPPPIDIDDVVYLIAYIFTGGPPPTPYAVASGDPTSDCLVDIDDVVQLIAWIFIDGYDPVTCEEWIDACGLLH